jgi:hypothetical protein
MNPAMGWRTAEGVVIDIVVAVAIGSISTFPLGDVLTRSDLAHFQTQGPRNAFTII